MMSLIHQFASNQDDSLSEALSLTLKKVMPVTLTGLVLGLLIMLAVFPGAIVGSILASGIENEYFKNVFVGIVIAIPISFIMYRCFFAAYFTLVDGLSPMDALKASNQQVKGNTLIFRGFMLLSVVMAFYLMLLVIFNMMIAVNPVALSFLEFVLNVLVMPFLSVYIYRLFALTKPSESQEQEE